MNKNNMNDTSKIASAINDLKDVKIPVKIDGENKTITKIIPVKGHDNMFFFEVVEKDSIMPEFVIPFKDNYDVCVKAVNWPFLSSWLWMNTSTLSPTFRSGL